MSDIKKKFAHIAFLAGQRCSNAGRAKVATPQMTSLRSKEKWVAPESAQQTWVPVSQREGDSIAINILDKNVLRKAPVVLPLTVTPTTH